MRLSLGVVLFLLFLPATQAYCTAASTPHVILVPLSASIPVGSELNGSLSLVSNDSGVMLGAAFVTEQIANFSFNASSGAFTLVPLTEQNETRILFYAVSSEGCTATAVVTYGILHAPIINVTPLTPALTVREGETLRFTAATNGVLWRWLLDNKTITLGAGTYVYAPDYNAAGTHIVAFAAAGPNGLTATKVWNVTVVNVNRPPIQVARIPGATLPLHLPLVLNLNNYFLDPDRTQLNYASRVAYPGQETYVEPANLSVTFESGTATIEGLAPGSAFLTFIATDAGNASAESDPTNYIILNTSAVIHNSFCGDLVCLGVENCTTCPQDCKKCGSEACVPHWECTEWTVCMPAGYQYRNCTVTNGCPNATERPSEAQRCEYNATCFDNIKNGNETGVDCGGSCQACPTCSDGIKNQGESGVDCGGPCAACPTCNDSIQNQDESDVDCGGTHCTQCIAGRRCLRPADCSSYLCDAGTCANATCSDGIRNQGESGVDCGGPCAPCPTCFDSIKNQGETGVDCGGPCAACPTCFDGIKNQGEELIDCGGPCRQCSLHDYLPTIFHTLHWVILTFLALAILYLLHAILTSRMIFLIQNGKAIDFFYEDPPTYALVKAWNSVARHLRFSRCKDLADLIHQAEGDIAALGALPSDRLRGALAAKLRGLYAVMLNLSPGFELEQLLVTVKHSHLPFSVKVILLKNTKLLFLLELSRLYEDTEYTLREALADLEDLRKAF